MSELSLIKYIRKKIPQRRGEIAVGIGDDAMVLKNGLVISTDSFAEKIHFDFKYFSIYQLGYRAMSASLSDLAAMAARPVCALISLYLPSKTKDSEIRELYKGFSAVCKKFQCDISGGDIIASPFWGVTVTVVGKTKKPLLRSGAKPGDILYTTGYLGLAETGRIALAEGYKKNLFPESIKKHLYPEPRIFEALKLRNHTSACIDTSDGLSTDAFHLAEESDTKIIIENVPIHPEVQLLCRLKKISPVKFILSAGEDFELLITGKKINTIKNIKLFRIGRIEKGQGVYLLTEKKLKRIYPTGYEHLK